MFFAQTYRLCAATFALLSGAVSSGAWAQTAPVSVPAVPVATVPGFATRVAGRAAVSDGIYALTAAPRLSVSARWRVLTRDERGRVAAQSGTESLLLDSPANHVALVSQTNATPNRPESVTRYVSDGTTLLATRFAPSAPDAKPKPGAVSDPPRTFFRIAIEGDIETATEALILAKADESPLTRVARIALLSPLDNGGYGWRGRGTFTAQPDGTVLEVLPPNANDRRTVTTTRRYRFDVKTRRPLAIEEWIATEIAARKATRTTYRQESFVYAPFPTRTDLFATKPAANYAETPPPSGATLPDPPGPDRADTKARALLSRWERAWARFTAVNVRVSVSAQTLAQTPESVPVAPQDASREGTYTLYYERPGKLYLSAEPDARAGKDANGNDRVRRTLAAAQSAVSDGKTLAVYDANKRRGAAQVDGDDSRLRQALRGSGFDDRAEALTWLFDGAQSLFGNAEAAQYRGALPLPGGDSAEAVMVRQTVTQNGGGRRQRGNRRGAGGITQVVITSTIYFDSTTGLPRRIERFISTTGDAVLQRDNPPNRYFSMDYTGIRLNSETAPNIFTLP